MTVASGGHDSPPSGAAPGSTEQLDRLKALLREMFRLDRGDLDFGLYRIMNLKAAEVAAFLDRDLLPQVKTKLNLTTAEERARLEEDLEEASTAAWKLGLDPDSAAPPAIVELNRRLAEMKKDGSPATSVGWLRRDRRGDAGRRQRRRPRKLTGRGAPA